MVLNTKDNTSMERNMEKGTSNGQMDQLTQGNSLTIIFMGTDIMSGLMAEIIEGPGRIIRWMEREYLLGKMEEFMKESIMMTRKKVMENSHGPTEESIRGTGFMENSMAKECTFPRPE